MNRLGGGRQIHLENRCFSQNRIENLYYHVDKDWIFILKINCFDIWTRQYVSFIFIARFCRPQEAKNWVTAGLSLSGLLPPLENIKLICIRDLHLPPKKTSHSLLIYVNIAMHWFVYPPHLCFHLAQIYWPTNSVWGRHGDKQSAGYRYTHDLWCQAAAAGYSSSILITAGCSQVERKNLYFIFRCTPNRNDSVRAWNRASSYTPGQIS